MVNAGGTLWPGATGETGGHTLTVNGSVAFAGTGANPALFQATGFVSPTGVVSNDILNITGNLYVANTQVSLLGVYLPGHKYTFVTYSAIDGSFTLPATIGDQNTLMKFVTGSYYYDADPAFYLVPQSSLQATGVTRNQIATATAINTAANLGAYGAGGASLLGRLIAYNSQATAPRAFDALSGEGLTGQQQTALRAGNLFVTTMMDQATLWSGGREDVYIGMKDGGYKDARPEAASTAARLWATGFGQQASLGSDSTYGSASLSSNASGFAAGMDYEATRNFIFGGAAGYSYSNFSVSDRATKGSVEGAHAGLYGIAHAGSFYLAGAGEYANYDGKASRTIGYTDGFFDELARAKFSSDEWLTRFEGGYKYRARWTYTPFAGFQLASLDTGAFSETSQLGGGGAGVAGLHVNGQTTNSQKSFIGLQVDTKTVLSGWTATPYARVSWEHEFSPKRPESAYLLSIPSASFTVYGAPAAADVARVQAGIKADVARNVGLFASFDGEFSGRSDSYAGTGGVTIRW